jgi:hypothetical protein
MPKTIAVVAYNLDPASALTADAIVFRDRLNGAGYSAQLVHQWAFNETNAGTFKSQGDWKRYDGVVISSFYPFWNLRELVRAGRPVLCANAGYADDLGLGERDQEHVSEDDFNVVSAAHPIISGAAVPPGPVNVGSPVWVDSISTLNHHVDVLITTLAGQAVLAAHKTEPLLYFGWYRMSQASSGSVLFTLLARAAQWVFSGP